jgi:hypothetical protein
LDPRILLNSRSSSGLGEIGSVAIPQEAEITVQHAQAEFWSRPKNLARVIAEHLFDSPNLKSYLRKCSLYFRAGEPRNDFGGVRQSGGSAGREHAGCCPGVWVIIGSDLNNASLSLKLAEHEISPNSARIRDRECRELRAGTNEEMVQFVYGSPARELASISAFEDS